MQKTISSVTSLPDRRLTAPNITAQQNQYCGKKIDQHPLWEDSAKLAYMAELLSRNYCWRNQTISKGSSGPRYTKTEQWSSGIKSFVLMKQSLKYLGQIGRSIYSEKLVKELQPNCKARMRLYYVWGWVPTTKSGICTKWRANWIRLVITPYCSHTWSHLECCLLVKNFYSCKIMT